MKYIKSNFKEEKTKSRLTIDLSHVDESGKVIEIESVEGVCQHNVTWDNIQMVRNPIKTLFLNL